MNVQKNEKPRMNKIIKVSGCHECPYHERTFGKTQALPHNGIATPNTRTCGKDQHSRKELEKRTNIIMYVSTKTLPDNCPLEDEK